MINNNVILGDLPGNKSYEYDKNLYDTSQNVSGTESLENNNNDVINNSMILVNIPGIKSLKKEQFCPPNKKGVITMKQCCKYTVWVDIQKALSKASRSFRVTSEMSAVEQRCRNASSGNKLHTHTVVKTCRHSSQQH